MRKAYIWPGLLLIAAATARSSPEEWLAEFDGSAGHLPEQSGWNRYYAGGGAQRWFEDGCLILDSRANQSIYDFYDTFRPGLIHLAPGQVLLMSWRVRVDVCTLEPDLDVGVVDDSYWAVAFTLGVDGIYSAYEWDVSAPFAPGVFHDFELTSTDVRNYVLYIDGREAIRGSFWPYATEQSRVGWGDGITGPLSLSRWAYLHVGVVPAVRPGDLNCDGSVDFLDINPFVTSLADVGEFHAQYPFCPVSSGDINGDGAVDFRDISPFVAVLSGVESRS